MAKASHVARLTQGTDPARPIGQVVRPEAGWLRAVREALGLTLADQARRLKVTPPAVRSFEQAEAGDRITLASLRRVAAAMDCELVYTLVPHAGALAAPIRSKNRDNARAGQPTSAAPSAPAADHVVLDLTWRAQHGEE